MARTESTPRFVSSWTTCGRANLRSSLFSGKTSSRRALRVRKRADSRDAGRGGKLRINNLKQMLFFQFRPSAEVPNGTKYGEYMSMMWGASPLFMVATNRRRETRSDAPGRRRAFCQPGLGSTSDPACVTGSGFDCVSLNVLVSPKQGLWRRMPCS